MRWLCETKRMALWTSWCQSRWPTDGWWTWDPCL